MLLKNFYKILASHLIYNGATVNVKAYDGSNLKVTANDGEALQIGRNSDSVKIPSMYILRTALSYRGGVIFGTGTTPVTFDDYRLSGNIIANIASTRTGSYTSDETEASCTVTHTITNNNSGEITIGEVGLVTRPGGSYSGEKYDALLERTVLDTPVTIPAGGVGQVTYTIRMNYPT